VDKDIDLSATKLSFFSQLNLWLRECNPVFINFAIRYLIVLAIKLMEKVGQGIYPCPLTILEG